MTPDTDGCDACLGYGWELDPDSVTMQNPKGARRRCQQCDYWERQRGCAPGIPDEEKATLFTTYGTDRAKTDGNVDALKHAEFFVKGVHPGLYLHGTVGSGKTAIACAALNEAYKAGRQVRFYRVQELLNKLMPGSDAMDALFDQVVAIPMICLDDVGASQGTDFARRQLQAIFDARCDRAHQTIWTSNLDLDELTEHLGEDKRLSSRIAGTCKIQEVSGPDYRIRKGRKRQHQQRTA